MMFNSQNQNLDNSGGNLINNDENMVPNKTPGSSTEYDKSNNKIMKFPVEKFDGVKFETLAQNSQKHVLKEKMDDIPIDYILNRMCLNKKETCLTLKKRLRQLTNEIPQEVSQYENDKQTFHRDDLSKNKFVKFMPVAFERLINSLEIDIRSIKNEIVKTCFQDCLKKYTTKLKNALILYNNILDNINVNCGDIADKFGDSALIYQLLEKQKTDSNDIEKELFDQHARNDAPQYAKQLIAVKTNYNSYCEAVQEFNRDINELKFDNYGYSAIDGFAFMLFNLSQQWWRFNNCSLFNDVYNLVSKLNDNSLTPLWNDFCSLINGPEWHSLHQKEWNVVCGFWDKLRELTSGTLSDNDQNTKNCLEQLVNIYKKAFLLKCNASKLKDLADSIQQINENKLNSDFNKLEKLHDREVLLKQKRNAAFDISQTIMFYFKNYNENEDTNQDNSNEIEDTNQDNNNEIEDTNQDDNNEINEIYGGMLFDGCNGCIPGFYENGEYVKGFLLLWDPINNSNIKITEDELKNCKFPIVATENTQGNCFVNSVNAMFVHVPAFYLYFKKLGEKLKSLNLDTDNIGNGQLNEIKKKFPFAYEMAMYAYSLDKLSSSQSKNEYVPMEDFCGTLGKLDKRFSNFSGSTNSYLSFLVERLDQELKVPCNVGSKVDVEHNDADTPKTNYLRCFHNSEINICKLDSSPIRKLLNANTIIVNHHDTCNTYSMSLQYSGIEQLCQIMLSFIDQSEKQKYGNEISLKNMLAMKNLYEIATGFGCSVCNKEIKTTNAGARCLFNQNSTIVPIIINREQSAGLIPTDNNAPNNDISSAKTMKTKIPLYVKSGSSCYELVSVQVLAGNSGMAGHLYSFVKNPKTDAWYRFNDRFVKREDDLDKLQNAIESTGYVYLYHKCSEKKYNDHKNKDSCEDISEVSFDPDNVGITKSPLYLNDTNGDLQTGNWNNIDLAIDSLKKHWQDPAMGILDKNGKLLSFGTQTKDFNICFLLSSIVLFAIAILSAILLTSPFHPLSVVFFIVGLCFLFPSFKYRCFSYYLKKCFTCCFCIDSNYTHTQGYNNEIIDEKYCNRYSNTIDLDLNDKNIK